MHGTMKKVLALVLVLPIALASPTVFSVYDDILAFPQVSCTLPITAKGK